MKNRHWTTYLTDSKAIESVYAHEDIPDLKDITIENIKLGFNLNSIDIFLNFPVPSHPPKKYIIKKYNIIYSTLSLMNIESIKIEKQNLYCSEEKYNFSFLQIDNSTKVKIVGSLGTNIFCTAKFIALLNFEGCLIE